MERVIIDTNTLVAAIVFPESMGREIIKSAEEDQFLLILPEYIRKEVQEVIKRDFPSFSGSVSKYLSIAHESAKLPSLESIKRCLAYIADEKDAPILASVIEAKPNYFVTADIEHFHTDKIKTFLEEQGTQIRSPYGFLKEYGKR